MTVWSGRGSSARVHSSPSARPSSPSLRVGCARRTVSTSTWTATWCGVPPGTTHRSGPPRPPAPAPAPRASSRSAPTARSGRSAKSAPDWRTITVGAYEQQLAAARPGNKTRTGSLVTAPPDPKSNANRPPDAPPPRRPSPASGAPPNHRRRRPPRRRRQPQTASYACRDQHRRNRMGHRQSMSRTALKALQAGRTLTPTPSPHRKRQQLLTAHHRNGRTSSAPQTDLLPFQHQADPTGSLLTPPT